MNTTVNGYEERSHPSDLALFVWADSLSELFVQAVKGLCALIKPELLQDKEIYHTDITCEAVDTESLLVAFLNEILHYLNEQDVLFVPSSVRMEQNRMTAIMDGQRVSKQGREIKAATYSDLFIRKTLAGFETTIVFDI